MICVRCGMALSGGRDTFGLQDSALCAPCYMSNEEEAAQDIASAFRNEDAQWIGEILAARALSPHWMGDISTMSFRSFYERNFA